MITCAKIKNFMGIENEITINCLASNKIKRNSTPFVSTDEGLNILKNIGIIGSNGSGKTSILNAFATIQTFVNFPFRKSANNNQKFIEQIKQLPKEMLEQILDDFNNLKLPAANINHSNEDTFISIEMYIPEDKHNIGGYYNYSLLYDFNYQKNGIKEEKLTYRKKYNSKKDITIFCVNNIIESELGTTLLYKNNNLNISKQYIEYYDSIGNEIINKMDFIFAGDSLDLNYFYSNHKKLFNKLCNLADEKIIKTNIEKRNNQDIIIFLNKDSNKLYFEQLSVGTQKIIVLGCKLINSIENNRIVFVDELEMSLHPSLANFLVMIIQKLEKKSYNQLFFTTHSIDLAMQIDNDQLYYIDNKLNDYKFLCISDAIKKGIITKDKNVQRALAENLLINNPDINKINDFINSIN
ncbi:MAG: ATP-binding protein [Bacilli bacterium]|nr:ATP-binding protein [Bacilli bacterium]